MIRALSQASFIYRFAVIVHLASTACLGLTGCAKQLDFPPPPHGLGWTTYAHGYRHGGVSAGGYNTTTTTGFTGLKVGDESVEEVAPAYLKQGQCVDEHPFNRGLAQELGLTIAEPGSLGVQVPSMSAAACSSVTSEPSPPAALPSDEALPAPGQTK